MIPPHTLKKICSEYVIGDFISIEKIQEGVLNDNYLLITTQGKYFIKSVREKAKAKLASIFEVETLMKSRNIPAITMLQTKTGDIFLTDENSVYTLYPFIQIDIIEEYSDVDYVNMGELLGKIHLAGSKDIPENLKLKTLKKQPAEVVLEKFKKYKEQILNKHIKDDTDKLFLEYIDVKISACAKIPELVLENDTLTHGDYHPMNLLIDKKSHQIIGVCDWEKFEYAPRSYELARAILYTCFYQKNNSYDIKESLRTSSLFLKAYLSVFPMDQKQIIDGLSMRIYRTALSSWIEEKYFIENDARANKFITNEIQLLNDLVNKDLLQEISKPSI